MKNFLLVGLILAALIGGCRPVKRGEPAPTAEKTALAINTEEMSSSQGGEGERTRTPELSPRDTAASTAGGADADVLFVRAEQTAEGVWTFRVTVEHPDRGWEDYADGWDVVLPDGSVVKPDPDTPFTRLLLHPHENEQPFTRSQSGIEIPEKVKVVRVRAHDIVDGFGGKEIEVDLTRETGPDFEVIR